MVGLVKNTKIFPKYLCQKSKFSPFMIKYEIICTQDTWIHINDLITDKNFGLLKSQNYSGSMSLYNLDNIISLSCHEQVFDFD